MSTSGERVNRLTNQQHYQLCKMLDARKDWVEQQPNTQAVAEGIAADIGFQITVNNIKGALRDIGVTLENARHRTAATLAKDVADLQGLLEQALSEISSLTERIEALETQVKIPCRVP